MIKWLNLVYIFVRAYEPYRYAKYNANDITIIMRDARCEMRDGSWEDRMNLIWMVSYKLSSITAYTVWMMI